MSSLLGLYDLFVETGDPAVGRLFTDGIEGLKTMLPTWDYLGSDGVGTGPASTCVHLLITG
jgi:hypothetical protein